MAVPALARMSSVISVIVGECTDGLDPNLLEVHWIWVLQICQSPDYDCSHNLWSEKNGSLLTFVNTLIGCQRKIDLAAVSDTLCLKRNVVG